MSAATVSPAVPTHRRKSGIKSATRKLRELGLWGMRWPLPGTSSWRRSCPCGSAIFPAPTATSTTRSPSRCRWTRCCAVSTIWHGLGTSIITISGGEPLTHPDLDQIIARIRHHGRLAGMITNGYFLMPERIERLNQAGP